VLDCEEFPWPETTLQSPSELKTSLEALVDLLLIESGITYGGEVRRAYPDLKVNHVHHAGIHPE
tara:strand:- start:50 stop:241 length:192 start_codon:yes stop_codon:yes gene_type:complete